MTSEQMHEIIIQKRSKTLKLTVNGAKYRPKIVDMKSTLKAFLTLEKRLAEKRRVRSSLVLNVFIAYGLEREIV